MPAEKKVKYERTFGKTKYFNDEDYSATEQMEFEELVTKSFKNIREGEIIKGKIVAIDGDNVVLEVGFKSDGLIPK